jgi:hypothetical protein
MYSFSNVAYTQTDKVKAKAQQKEQILIQLDYQLETFLSTISVKREQNQEKKKALETELANLQSKKKKKKTQDVREKMIQDLKKKIIFLENKDKEYQRMEKDALAMRSSLHIQTLDTGSESADNTLQQGKTFDGIQTDFQDVTDILQQEKTLDSIKAGFQDIADTPQQEKKLDNIKTRSQDATDISQQEKINSDLDIQKNHSTATNYQSTTSQSHSNNSQFTPSSNVIVNYYIVFGSFKEKSNAERELSKLQKQYSNVVVMGKDNSSGMYRTVIGPYKTKAEAEAKKPKNIETWILKYNN